MNIYNNQINPKFNMDFSKPNWVNSILNIIGVNSLRLEGLNVKLILTELNIILILIWIISSI